MSKSTSRTARWNDAVSEAQSKLQDARDAAEAVVAALGELVELQQEYADWYDNMPEALQNGATGEKLSALADLELELDTDASFDELAEAIDAAEAADLPLGFGRD